LNDGHPTTTPIESLRGIVRTAGRKRAFWIALVAIAGSLFIGCAGLGVGFIIGNIVGENTVCSEVWDHAENPQDIPTCRDPWW
jgi:hypothetical protein